MTTSPRFLAAIVGVLLFLTQPPTADAQTNAEAVGKLLQESLNRASSESAEGAGCLVLRFVEIRVDTEVLGSIGFLLGDSVDPAAVRRQATDSRNIEPARPLNCVFASNRHQSSGGNGLVGPEPADHRLTSEEVCL